MSLEQFYDDIVTKATVDHSSPEIQDITSAVEEILKLLVSDEIIMDYDEGKLQTKFKFLLSYLQPCGSMAEKTSLWKSVRRAGRERKFIEFDYLAVLDNRDNVVDIREGKCQGCRYVFRENARLEVGTFNESFLSALYSRIPTMCSCIVEPDDTCSETDQRDTRPCDKCTAVRHTGYLQIAKLPDFDLDDVYSREQCSLVFYWTSYTDSLLAPNVETLQLTERIKRLVIRVDFLPAIEIPGNGDGEIKRFIIPKKYPRCFYGCFMVSHSMHELKKIIGVSEKHRQCYIIIKFLYGQLSYWSGADEYLKSYHAKIVFLTHCQTCTEDRDRDRCVTEIFQSLVKTYTSGSLQLPEFHAMKRLNIRHFSNRGGTKECMLLLLHILSQLKSPTETSQCYSQCHPSTAVIKGTCHKMLDGKLGINENGKIIIL